MKNQPSVFFEDNKQQRNEIVLLNALRVLKGKRAVFEATWKDEIVLVKLFTKERYWLKERKGLGFLSRFGLAHAQCLYSGLVSENHHLESFGIYPKQTVYFLVLKFYRNAQDFRSQWRSECLEEDQRKVLFSKLLILIAQHHQVGVVQNDLHLGNFLIVKNGLIAIDGDAIDHNELLSINECYRQLGILLAQSFPKYDELLETLLPVYFEERKLEINNQVIEQVLKNRTIYRSVAKKNWINKVYRESTQFKVLKRFNYLICISRAFVDKELEAKVFGLINSKENFVEWASQKYKFKAVRYTKNLSSERRNLAENEASIYWLKVQLKLFFGEDTVLPVALVINKLGPYHRAGFFVQAKAID